MLLNIPKYYQIIWEYPERGKSEIKNTNSSRVNSWIHIAYTKDNYKKTISLSSESSEYHTEYETIDTNRQGIYTHDLSLYQF